MLGWGKLAFGVLRPQHFGCQTSYHAVYDAKHESNYGRGQDQQLEGVSRRELLSWRRAAQCVSFAFVFP